MDRQGEQNASSTVLELSSWDFIFTIITTLVGAVAIARFIRSIMALRNNTDSMSVSTKPPISKLSGRQAKLPDCLKGQNLTELFASCPFMATNEENQSNSPMGSLESSGLTTPPSMTADDTTMASDLSRPQSTSKHGALLTEDEQAEEFRIRKEQLESIHRMMLAQPNRFGSISLAEMEKQMSHYYSSRTAEEEPCATMLPG